MKSCLEGERQFNSTSGQQLLTDNLTKSPNKRGSTQACARFHTEGDTLICHASCAKVVEILLVGTTFGLWWPGGCGSEPFKLTGIGMMLVPIGLQHVGSLCFLHSADFWLGCCPCMLSMCHMCVCSTCVFLVTLYLCVLSVCVVILCVCMCVCVLLSLSVSLCAVCVCVSVCVVFLIQLCGVCAGVICVCCKCDGRSLSLCPKHIFCGGY